MPGGTCLDMVTTSLLDGDWTVAVDVCGRGRVYSGLGDRWNWGYD